MTREHFVFTSHGQRILGVLHMPPAQPTAGAVFLHGWPGYRVGTHRLFVKAAHAAAERGLACLRFDFRGRGDSEGETNRTNLVTMIEDAIVAAQELVRRSGVKRLAFVGDCSGCEVAIGAGPLVEGLEAMVLWSAPIIGGARQEADAAKRRSVYMAYLRKLFSAESWRKLLRGAVRWDLVRKALATGGRGAGEEGAQVDWQIDWEGRFRAFPGERLFIYGGADPVTGPCTEFYQRLCAAAGLSFELYLVEGANHAFYSVAWEREVVQVSLDWLEGKLAE